MTKYASMSAAVVAAVAGLTLSAFGNDECVGAIEIFDGTNAASNLDAVTTTETCLGSNDVWYRYVATSTGSLEASTCGARTFDTTLAIWSGCPGNGGVQLACNDDSCVLGSRVSWEGVEGQTYYVRLAGYGGQQGTAEISIGIPGPSDIDAFGVASPDPVLAGESTLFEVYVTPGTNPASTGLAVTMDTSSLQGGSTTQALYDDGTNGDAVAGDNIFSYLQLIEGEQAEQTYEFGYVVSDLESRSFSGTIFLNVDVSNPDAVSAGITPNLGFPGTVALLEVEVFPAVNPDSTGIVVTADFSGLLGSATQQLFDDGTNGDQFPNDGTFSFAITIDGALAAGEYPINLVSVTDAQGRIDDDLPGVVFFVRIPAQWEEVGNGGGDAGDLPATAQIPTGEDPLTSVGGNLDSAIDADMFLINICDVATFGATSVGNGTFGDTQLFLFNTDGTGVTFNDDSQGSGQSTLSGTFVPGPGNYYLVLSGYDVDPLDANGQFIWTDTPFGTERQPDGPGAAGIVSSWSGFFVGSAEYKVTLSGTCFATDGPSCDYDFNQDENVDLTDAQQMAQVFVGLLTPEANWLDGDLNGDENADLTDAQILAAFVVTGNCAL